jgi:cytochrome c2
MRTTLLVGFLTLAGNLAWCTGERHPRSAYAFALGDPDAGRAVIRSVDCGSCHTIPGIRGAHGVVGPPLTSFARRTYIGGTAPNTPANLVRWLQNPQSIEPHTAMPNLGLDEQQARSVAAYLYTLR